MLLWRSPATSPKGAEATGETGAYATVVARRYYLHAPGIVYTVISVLIVLGAINGQNNLLFWAFGLAVAGMLVSGFLSGAVLMGVQVRRETLYPTDAGSPLLIRYTIRNKNRVMPGFALTIEELEAPKAKRGTKASWPGMMARPVAFVPHLSPRGVLVVDATVTPWARGVATFEALRVSTTFPFGLTFKSVVFTQAQEVVIRPWRPTLSPGALRRLLSAGGHADRTVQRRGVGEETYGLREYRAGESTRTVAWKPTARHGRLIVRETAQRTPASVVVAIGGASSPEARERVVSLAASIASRACAEGLEVGVDWAEVGVVVAPSASAGAGQRVLDALARGQPGSGRPVPVLNSSDRTTRVVVHDGATVASARGSVLMVSIDDDALVGKEEWSRAPRELRAGARGSEPGGVWARVARVLGRLG